MLWLLKHTAGFPKHERFRLAKRIEDAAFNFHECLLRAAQSQHVYADLLEAGVELNKLRAYLRLTMEYKYLAPNQYAYAAEQLTEIGKLVGGWRKSAKA